MSRRSVVRMVFSRSIDRADDAPTDGMPSAYPDTWPAARDEPGDDMADTPYDSQQRRSGGAPTLVVAAAPARQRAPRSTRRQMASRILALVVLVGSLVVLPSGQALAEARLGDPIPVGNAPVSIAANPATNRIYVGNAGDANISVIDGTTNAVAHATIPIGTQALILAVNPVTNRIYASDFDAGAVLVVDGATQKLVGSPIKVGSGVQPVAVNPKTNRIYAGSLNDFTVDSDATVTVIDGDTNMVIGKPIEVPRGPRGIGIDTDLNRIYASAESENSVTVIDGTNNTIIGAPIKVGGAPQTIGVNSNTHRVYVANADDATVTVISSVTNTVVGSPISVGKQPDGVVVNPDLNLVYVTSTENNNVTVIDGATNTAVGSPITVHFPLTGIDVLTTTGRVYVPEPADNRVAVVGVPLTIDGNAATSQGTVTATWSSLFVPNGGDFIGLFEPGAPNTAPLSRRFTNGTSAAGGAGLGDGSVDLPLPSGLAAGHTYEARLVSGRNGGGTLARIQTALLAATSDSYTTGPTGTLSVPAPGVLANDTDPRSPALKATVVSNPTHGTLSLQPDGAFSYTPAVLFSGTDSFTYRASSDGDLPSVATVTITVTAAPVGANDAYSIEAGGVLTVPAPGVLANDTDPDSPTLRAAVGTRPAHGALSLQPDGSFTYTPAAGFSGSDTFTYLASDQTSASLPVTVTITVAAAPGNPAPGAPGPGNAPPAAANDAFTTSSGAALTVPAPGVLANDTDPGSRPLQAVAVTGPAHGSLTLQPSGAFTYTPSADFAGADSFTYVASDGSAQSSPATATVFVSSTDCAPRPRVQAAPAAGGGKLQVHVEATPLNSHAPNPLRVLRFGTFQNAKVTLDGQPIASGQTFTVPSSSAIDFTVERVTPGQPTTVPLTVVDGCGEWPTFVGGGTSAGF